MNYWIIINETEQGPFSIDELSTLSLTPDTPVWCDGMSDWLPASAVPELAPLLQPVQATRTVIETQPAGQQPVPEAASHDTETSAATDSPSPASTVIYAPVDAIPPGYVALQAAEPKCPPTYLVMAIISTIVCFLPLGVCAIICSTKVRKHFRNGDYAKAACMSERTALFIIISIVAWLIWMPFSVVFAMI